MADVVEVNAATGEVVERTYTPAEKALRASDDAAAKQADMERETDQQAALAKLAALGITETDLHALGL